MRLKTFLCGVVLVGVSVTVMAQEKNQEGGSNPLGGLNSFLKGVTDSINSTAAQAQGGTRPQAQQPGASSGNQRRKISGTKLANIFSSHPATGDAPPEWPRIAISIAEIPQVQLENHYMVHKPTATECMRFSVKYWTNAKTVETFNDLELCGGDIPSGVSFSKLMVWKNFPVAGKTAGQVRIGPTPPYNKLPQSPTLDRWFMNDTGYHYLGSLLYSLGYDWNYAPDSRRIWVAKVEG